MICFIDPRGSIKLLLIRISHSQQVTFLILLQPVSTAFIYGSIYIYISCRSSCVFFYIMKLHLCIFIFVLSLISDMINVHDFVCMHFFKKIVVFVVL